MSSDEEELLSFSCQFSRLIGLLELLYSSTHSGSHLGHISLTVTVDEAKAAGASRKMNK